MRLGVGDKLLQFRSTLKMTRRMQAVRTVLLWSLILGVSMGVAQPLPLQARLRIIEATVLVLPFDVDSGELSGAHGSGVVISGDGLVITNFHVIGDLATGDHHEWSALGMVDPANPARVADVRYWARVVTSNSDLDLAVLKIERTYSDNAAIGPDPAFNFVEIGDPNRLIPGDELTVFGYPGIGGFSITVTSGIMSGWTGEEGTGQGQDWIKSDVNVSPGNSGGGAFNRQGELVAIATATRFRQDEGGSYGDMTLMRPVNMAWPLIHASSVAPPRSARAPSGVGTPQANPSALDSAEFLACEGLERLYFVTANSLQIRNALRLAHERVVNGPHWVDTSLQTARVGDLEAYKVLASNLQGQGAYFLGLTIDSKLNFVNEVGDFATVLFSCVENLGDAELGSAYDFGTTVLASLAATGISVLGATEFEQRFPNFLMRFPVEACADWACSNQLADAWFASPAVSEATEDTEPAIAPDMEEGDQPLIPEAAEAFADVERGAGRMLWADLPRAGYRAQLVFSGPGPELLAQGSAAVTSVAIDSGILTVTLEVSVQSLVQCRLNLGFEIRMGGDVGGLLNGNSTALVLVEPGSETVVSTTVHQLVDSPADVYAVPIIAADGCEGGRRDLTDDATGSSAGRGALTQITEEDRVVTVVATVDELVSAVRSSDVIVLRPGTYRLNRSLVISRSLELIGAGPTTTRIVGIVGPNVIQVSSVPSSDANITVRDLTVEYEGPATADVILIDDNARGEVNIQNVVVLGARYNLPDAGRAPVFKKGAGITVHRVEGSDAPKHPVEVTISNSQVISRRAPYGVYANVADGDVVRLLGNEVRAEGDVAVAALVILGSYFGTDATPPAFEVERNDLYVTSEGPVWAMRVNVDYLADSTVGGAAHVWIRGSVHGNYLQTTLTGSDVSSHSSRVEFSHLIMIHYRFEHHRDFVSPLNSSMDFVSNRLRTVRGSGNVIALPCAFHVSRSGYEGYQSDVAADPSPRTSKSVLGCYQTPSRAVGDGWFRGSDNVFRARGDSGRNGAFKWPDANVMALIPASASNDERGAVTEAPEVEKEAVEAVMPEPPPERREFVRAVYLPDPDLLAAVQLRQEDTVAEAASLGGACGNLTAAFHGVPEFGDNYLDTLRIQAMEIDGCEVIADALVTGQGVSSLMRSLQEEDAQLADTLRQAEHCVIQQATLKNLDPFSVIEEIYDGSYGYGGGSILLDSCARAAVESYLNRIGLNELMRQVRTLVD